MEQKLFIQTVAKERYSAIRTLAAILAVVGWCGLVFGILGAVICAADSNSNFFSCVYLVIAGIAMLAYAQLLKLAVNVADDVRQLASR